MAAQLTGVLRETVARDGPIPAVDSAIFLSEQSMPGNPALLEDLWRRLPNLRLDAADSAVAAIFAAGSGDAQSRRSALERIVRAQPNSAEARLRLADALIDAGPAEVETVMRLLDAVLALDPADWRPDWYCGKLYLSLWRPPADAIDCFDNVYTQIPGEPAAKLALAMALEADGRTAEASGLYDTVSRTDPALVSASFGFARCMTQAGNRAGAVAALARVPDSAALAATARIASVHILADGMPGEADLRQAAQILAALDRDDRARHEAEATVALAAARQAEAGALIANGAALLGVPVTGRALRARAEAALRACARLSDTQAARIGYIDQANAVRPRTLL
jgi:serine/threonine-protein kinase PknG